MEEKLEEVVEETTKVNQQDPGDENVVQVDESKFESAGDDGVIKVDSNFDSSTFTTFSSPGSCWFISCVVSSTTSSTFSSII